MEKTRYPLESKKQTVHKSFKKMFSLRTALGIPFNNQSFKMKYCKSGPEDMDNKDLPCDVEAKHHSRKACRICLVTVRV